MYIYVCMYRYRVHIFYKIITLLTKFNEKINHLSMCVYIREPYNLIIFMRFICIRTSKIAPYNYLSQPYNLKDGGGCGFHVEI
jgi:hypothetical protein